MLASDFFPAADGGFDAAALNVLGYALDGGHASGTLEDGYVWNFADGDILATKTGANYSSESDVYGNGAYGSDLCVSGSASAINYSTGWEPAKAVDDNDTTSWASYSYQSGITWWGYDFGVTRSVHKISVNQLSTNYVTSIIVQAWNGSSFVNVQTFNGLSSGISTLELASTMETSKFRLVFNSAIYGGGGNTTVKEISAQERSVSNATLIPSFVSVSSAPSRMVAYFLVDPVDAVTLGTDLKIRVSRDGGSNWSGYGAVAEVAAYDANYNLIKADFPASALPASGTSPLWELATYNEKEIRARAAALFVE